MTRVIGGSARGRRLRVPTAVTRPTSDRVRESLFASVEHELGGLLGTRVLDLYAGSGALGLEAASRGALRVVLVERDRSAAAVARANALVVAAAGVEVVTAAVAAYLARDPQEFDLVLADPPYSLPATEVEVVLERLAQGWLAHGALVVVERAARDGGFAWPARLRALRQRTYGSTSLWYGQQEPVGEEP